MTYSTRHQLGIGPKLSEYTLSAAQYNVYTLGFLPYNVGRTSLSRATDVGLNEI